MNMILFAQAPAQPPPWAPIVMMAGIMGIFYFIVMRPQMKQRKEHAARIKALQKHDEVVTVGGLHGTVVNLKETSVTVRFNDTTRIEVDRDAIARVVKEQSNG